MGLINDEVIDSTKGRNFYDICSAITGGGGCCGGGGGGGRGGRGGQVMLGCVLARCASAIKIPAERGTLAPPLAARRKRS